VLVAVVVLLGYRRHEVDAAMVQYGGQQRGVRLRHVAALDAAQRGQRADHVAQQTGEGLLELAQAFARRATQYSSLVQREHARAGTASSIGSGQSEIRRAVGVGYSRSCCRWWWYADGLAGIFAHLDL